MQTKFLTPNRKTLTGDKKGDKNMGGLIGPPRLKYFVHFSEYQYARDEYLKHMRELKEKRKKAKEALSIANKKYKAALKAVNKLKK